ncbi:DUF3572 domain-containing protein [Defluviimonas sp. SAOS-178_SWC]|uniref:DUF3572 domain-containing protein n=1 Tax=Defluviimonas sp. SAOS-178_SWC TaxID=3121287 RepID=UPI00322221F5
MRNGSVNGRADADTVALKALGWLAGQDDLLPVFLGATGTAPEELKRRLSEPEFLVSVLDFILMDDAWVIAFCDAEGLEYTLPKSARHALPGGEEAHWT